MAINKIQRNTFGVNYKEFPVPNLNSMQIDSFTNFWKNEFVAILQEQTPFTDATGKWKIEFGPQYTLEAPTTTPIDAMVNSSSFTSRLSVRVTLENTVTKQKKMQDIFICNMPMMTPNGTFIVNGTQKIVVGQLVKAPGVLFSLDYEKNKPVYTAKIIPVRGVWIDFELGDNGVIYTRLDRKKKFPITQLFRVLGLTSDSEILSEFASIDTNPKISYIQNTLDNDNSSDVASAINAVYNIVRSGDLAYTNQAQKHIVSLLSDGTKYDFGVVGRYKFNIRLNIGQNLDNLYEYKKTIGLEEIVLVCKELIRMKNEQAHGDPIDSLENRRVKSVGDWLTTTFKSGLTRVIKHTKEKIQISEDENFTPAQIVNVRPMSAMIEDFFNTSQLSRLMDQTNIISQFDDSRFITATGPGGLTKERASFEVRDIQPSYYGRIGPDQTPEGASYGLNVYYALYSRVNKLGFLETPYFRVTKELDPKSPELIGKIALEDITAGKEKILKAGALITKDIAKSIADSVKTNIPVRPFVSKEVVWMDSLTETRFTICENTSDIDDDGNFAKDFIGARVNGEPSQVSINDVDYSDVAPNQILSLASAMVPFLSQTNEFRAMVGANQQSQAVPCVRLENPKVATGLEKYIARDCDYVSKAKEDGEIVYADGLKVILEGDSGQKYEYSTIKFMPSNGHTAINQKVVVQAGEKVKKDDIIIEGFGIHNGEFAVGQNVRVAFISYKGYNYEDAIILSERLIQKDKFTSNHIYEFTCDVHETRLGNEEITKDIANVANEKLSKLGEDGIVRIGTYVESGDILVGKITPKGEVDLSPEDKLIRVLFGEYSRDVKDSSLYLQHGLSGKVIAMRIFSREDGHSLPTDVLKRVHIWLATTRRIKKGDKIAGRHGNKGVVSIILPVEDMPYTADGNPVDVVLNPLSVISRMNLGQLLETHLGLVCDTKNDLAVTQPLNDIPPSKIQEEFRKLKLPEDGKLDLFDGCTGEKYDQRVVVGSIYLNKLHHLVDDKMHARSTGPYSLVTRQPLQGRSHQGGQRFGEMEVWALEAYGAAYALQEMLTIKSDDVAGRDAAFESIVKNRPIMSPNLPGSFVVLANELTALGIRVNAVGNEITKKDAYSKGIDADLALNADAGKLV
ncbi:MAG: DNA-directed RNA polymerase subunit beta [Patescibacteria group bacterium]